MKHDAKRGEWRDGDARYLLIRNDSLMGMFRFLDERSRNAVMEAMRESVMQHGGRSAKRYAAENRGAFLAAVTAKATELGWGLWHFAPEDGALRLIVENSPFPEGHGAAKGPVCAPIAGMLQSVASLALGGPALSEELRCVANGQPHCEFRAWLRR